MNPDIVSNLRILEDGLLGLILLLVMVRLAVAAWRMRQIPYGRVPLSLAIGLLPFMGWKVIGAIRRIIIAREIALYDSLHDFGELLEALSGLVLAVAVYYVYRLLKQYNY